MGVTYSQTIRLPITGPAAFDYTGTDDLTDRLNSWLGDTDRIPNGPSAIRHTRFVFPRLQPDQLTRAVYRVDGTIVHGSDIANRTYDFEGSAAAHGQDGAQLLQTVKDPYVVQPDPTLNPRGHTNNNAVTSSANNRMSSAGGWVFNSSDVGTQIEFAAAALGSDRPVRQITQVLNANTLVYSGNPLGDFTTDDQVRYIVAPNQEWQLIYTPTDRVVNTWAGHDANGTAYDRAEHRGDSLTTGRSMWELRRTRYIRFIRGQLTGANQPTHADWSATKTYADASAGWQSDNTYALNARAGFGDQTYRSLANGNVGHQPNISPTWWQAIGFFRASFDGANWESKADNNLNHRPDRTPAWWDWVPHYDQSVENQDAFKVRGVDTCLELGDLTIEGFYGQSLEAQIYDDPNTGISYPAKNIWIHDCQIRHAFGRQWMSLTFGGDWILERDLLDGAARSGIDLEPVGSSTPDVSLVSLGQDLHIRNCTIGKHGLGMVACHASVSRIHVNGCVSTGHPSANINTSGVTGGLDGPGETGKFIWTYNIGPNASQGSSYFDFNDCGDIKIIGNTRLPSASPGVQFHHINTWANGTTYADDDVVAYNGERYVSRVNNNTGHQPDISPSFWTDSNVVANCFNYSVHNNDWGGSAQFEDLATPPWAGSFVDFNVPVPANTFRDIATTFSTATVAAGGIFSAHVSGIQIIQGSISANFGGTFHGTGRRVVHGSNITSFGGSNFGGTFHATGHPIVKGSSTTTFGGVFSASSQGATIPATATFNVGGTFESVGEPVRFGTATTDFGGDFVAFDFRNVEIGTPDVELGGVFTAQADQQRTAIRFARVQAALRGYEQDLVL